MNFKSINSKIVLSYIVFSALLASAAGVTLFANQKQKKNSMEVITKWYPAVSKTAEINLNMTKYRLAQMTLLTDLSAEDQVRWIEEAESSSQNLFIYQKTLDSHLSDMNEADFYKIYEEFASVWEQYSAEHENYINLIKEKKISEAKALLNSQLTPLYAKATELMSKMTDEGYLKGAGLGESAAKDFDFNFNLILTLTSLCLLIVIPSAYFISKNIKSQLLKLSQVLSESAEEFTEKSFVLANSAHDLSSAATESAAGLEESAASMEEMSSVVKLNTENSHKAAQYSIDGQEFVLEGQSKIQELKVVMGEISESSKKIEDILDLIDDIAFQTNLLSLNAAVEAARAGEQGRGFAVVADAVRQLAQKSGEAAKDISQLIQQSTQKTVKGVVLAKECEKAFEEIVISSNGINSLIKELSVASDEQLRGVEQVSDSLSQLDSAIQNNATNTVHVAQISEDLKEKTKVISLLVVQLHELAGTTSSLNTHEMKNVIKLESEDLNSKPTVKAA